MSATITIARDRTLKQPVRGYCLNPNCACGSGAFDRFEFTVKNDAFACPKCGANEAPLVGVLVLIHLLVHDQEKGEFKGMKGLRYRLACDRKREHLATNTNLEAATGTLAHVTCPGCRRAAARLNLKTNQGLAAELKKRKG